MGGGGNSQNSWSRRFQELTTSAYPFAFLLLGKAKMQCCIFITATYNRHKKKKKKTKVNPVKTGLSGTDSVILPVQVGRGACPCCHPQSVLLTLSPGTVSSTGMGPGAASQKLNADNHNRAGASIKWASALAPCHPVTKQQAGRPMLKTFMVSLPRILREPQEKTGAETGRDNPL